MGCGTLPYQRLAYIVSNETTDNFWAVFNNWAHDTPAVIFRRLYHDAQGMPLFYTMEDLPGLYIDVDPIVYVTASMTVRVVAGQLVKIDINSQSKKLVPISPGTCCDPQDICVVVDAAQIHTQWSLKNYDTN